ncbi:MAG: hypothetical protein ACYTF9_04550 [Planctomycetota bacterium]|jgi:hypothetical protein
MFTQQCACALLTLTASSSSLIAGGPAPDLTINEIDVDSPGADTAEFIELYDGGLGGTDLTGYVIVLYNGADDASYAVYDLAGFTTNADGFFLLASADVDGADLVMPTGQLQNGADAVALHVGDAAAFPNDTPVTTMGLVDAVVYGTADAADDELLAILGGPQVDEAALGDPATDSIARVPDGAGAFETVDEPSPGSRNTPEGTCPADVSGEGMVGVEDLVLVMLAWGSAGGSADVNGNGMVDSADLTAVLVQWGPCS